ncbi:MAG: hypothetical protein RIA08_16520 [Roseovarius sp.]|uniref:hypothetical protein n=1 Tax=Roseovarius sp. TaxID=1486281 RepID=UPI0032EBDC2D
MRILVHPGFHKTGTTSVQYGLERNAGVLGARVRVLQMDDFPDAIAAARRHSAQPAPRRLKKYAAGFAAAVAPLDPGDPRPVLVSSEKLLGWIPGRKKNWSYDATPELMERLADVLEGHFGTDAALTFYFTTRAAEDWARSVYWQNLRAMRITEDFAAYRPRLERAARLDDVVAATRDRLGRRATVIARPVEALAEEPQGPLGAILRELGVAADDLMPFKSYNMQPPGGVDELLRLNRSDLDDAALNAAKRERIQAYQREGLMRQKAGEGKPG